MEDVILGSSGNTVLEKSSKRNFLTEHSFGIFSVIFILLIGVLIGEIMVIQLFWGFVISAILALCLVSIVVLLTK